MRGKNSATAKFLQPCKMSRIVYQVGRNVLKRFSLQVQDKRRKLGLYLTSNEIFWTYKCSMRHTSPDGCESPYCRLGTRFCVHIVFVASAASQNVNEKIKTQTSSPPFVGGCMLLTNWNSKNFWHTWLLILKQISSAFPSFWNWSFY